MKAEKKAAEKEAKVKEHEEKESNNTAAQNACGDEETLDPNVRFFFFIPILLYSDLFILSTRAGETMSKVMMKGEMHAFYDSY